MTFLDGDSTGCADNEAALSNESGGQLTSCAVGVSLNYCEISIPGVPDGWFVGHCPLSCGICSNEEGNI